MRRAIGVPVGLGVILLMTMGAVTAALADPSPKSQAQITVGFSADCTDLTAGSSKDISFVEIQFSDGTVVKDESMASPQYSYEGGGQIGSVVVKSGTTEQTFTCEVAEPPPPTTTLGGFVWYDGSQLTQDGVQDPGEQGLSDIVVNLYDPSDALVATTSTDQDGRYLFQDLAPGTFVVEFVGPGEGWGFSDKDQGGDDTKDSDADPSTGRTDPIALGAGEVNLTIDAGLWLFDPGPDF